MNETEKQKRPRWEGPRVDTTADVVVFNKTTSRILLGRKRSDPEGLWRCVGGFADPEKDNSIVDTALRELGEEVITAPLEQKWTDPRCLHYLGSFSVNDPRYAESKDKIITHLYVYTISPVIRPVVSPVRFTDTLGNQTFNPHVQAGDDLDEVRWFDLYDFVPRMVPQHRCLAIEIYSFCNGKRY